MCVCADVRVRVSTKPDQQSHTVQTSGRSRLELGCVTIILAVACYVKNALVCLHTIPCALSVFHNGWGTSHFVCDCPSGMIHITSCTLRAN